MNTNISLSMGLTTGGFDYFFERKEGVDFRLNQKDRAHVKVGDIIEFLEDPEEKRRYLVKVVKLYKSDSFPNLIDSLPDSFPEKQNKESNENFLRKWWSIEDELNQGVIGYQIKVISDMLIN